MLTGSEVARLLAAVTSIKYRAVLTTAYGAGLRIGETLALDVSDIDSKRMLLRVRDGKTGGRFVVLNGTNFLAETQTGPILTPPQPQTDGSIRISATGLPGRTYPIESSADLLSWQFFASGSLTGGSASFSNAAPASPARRFYRAPIP